MNENAAPLQNPPTRQTRLSRCFYAVLLAIGYALAGVAASVLLTVLLGIAGNFLCGIPYVGIVFEIIGEFLSETVVGSLLSFFITCFAGMGAGTGYQRFFYKELKGKDTKRDVTLVICFLVGMAATFFAHLLVYTYNGYVAADGSLTVWEAFLLSPSLYIHSTFFHPILMILYRVVVVFVNTLIGFGVGTQFIEPNFDD